MTFAAGDVVFLKSGGEAMTIAAIDGEQVLCLWTGDDGDLFREMIPTVALQSAQEAEIEDEDEDSDVDDDSDEDDSDEDDLDEDDHEKSKKKKKEVV